ncbi:flavodoxin domain-containing protein [Marivita sp. XM-24bin2]|jgi:menaquinone-dependent protoporphyrinogen oxidase|uniref:flavodoxin domain-containing protein n=1 Tax=unclassified Marivita TaxID=2632480 RepID=UPI000D79CCEE|nr:flavodoxin domain-containing protein [Marivita sp. XM-24bin2]MCR9109853.1 protoporphyrinogen oxidase [Paracoccaceae bacterium]PWL36672.1 MAG: protoporphyrinogen oxidase [Marivita sp. XM-24bin2]
MKLFIGYASTEGQTQKIARHIADYLVDHGHSVELMALADAGPIALSRFDAAILGASVHVGHYQKVLSEFADTYADGLNAMPTMFLSVSLAAAGHDAEDWRALDTIISDVSDATGRTPGKVLQVAGAYTPSQYDVFRRFVMRRIIAAKDPEADLDWDKEYTDWEALDAETDGWLSQASI